MRLYGHTSPRGKQNKPRGSTAKNVGRVQPAEQSRICIAVLFIKALTRNVRMPVFEHGH